MEDVVANSRGPFTLHGHWISLASASIVDDVNASKILHNVHPVQGSSAKARCFVTTMSIQTQPLRHLRSDFEL